MLADGLEVRIKQVMADILDLSADSIDESTAMERIDSWDSLTHVTLCLAFEQEFHVSFEVSEIESMLSYTDFVEVLEKKL